MLLSFNFTALKAQELTYSKYWIAFTDKENTPYDIANPEAFLSEKAIERRTRYDIEIDESDLPVTPIYVQSLIDLDIEVLYTSRWFNGAVVMLEDSAQLEQLLLLNFVENTEPVSRLKKHHSKHKKGINAFATNTVFKVKRFDEMQTQDYEEAYYGTSFHQVKMLNGDLLHANGFTGEGMTVAIIDAGFKKVDEIEAFDYLFDNGKILGTRDFVDGDDNVYGNSSHGTHVFAIMAANLPNVYVGAAPDADYYLLRTEAGGSETTIEEYNWIAAAEFADSAGVDVINTSLGYSTFDDENMDYTYDDMDGNTTHITNGADMAAQKGILVVASAGNQGNKSWRYVTAPADADSILTVGAVDSLENYAFFSSQGMTADARVKPNIVGQGLGTTYISTSGMLASGNGTSYSAPLIAGLMTCLWQANPTMNNMDLIEIIEKSATQSKNPDHLLGYGLPDFYAALLEATNNPIADFDRDLLAFVYPNPFTNDANVYYYANTDENIQIELFNLAGKKLDSYEKSVRENTPYNLNFEHWKRYPKGTYIIQITNSVQKKSLKAIKL
ncbi:MAG: S8 family serine peptidase [Chitinophagales bacterium]